MILGGLGICRSIPLLGCRGKEEVPRLRRWRLSFVSVPALAGWANFWRTYGAGPGESFWTGSQRVPFDPAQGRRAGWAKA
jgi:hypothetical protein